MSVGLSVVLCYWAGPGTARTVFKNFVGKVFGSPRQNFSFATYFWVFLVSGIILIWLVSPSMAILAGGLALVMFTLPAWLVA